MDRIAIVGLGLIGRGWAIVFARAGHAVTAFDVDPAAMERGLGAIDASLHDLDDLGLLDEPVAAIRARIGPAESLAQAVGDADYVQESVAETLAAKREIFAALDGLAPRQAVLASSTSTIPASAFSGGLAGRDRCLVAHPVNPVHLIPVVELVPAPWTDAAVVERTRVLLEAARQSPVVVRKEIQGFILNRLQAALMSEAINLWEGGYASADDIDRTVRDGLGLRWSFMGPLETFDLAAPGGVVESGARYGPPFAQIVASQPANAWSAAAMTGLAAEREASQPRALLGERARWRDRRLMQLLAHKRAAAAREAARETR